MSRSFVRASLISLLLTASVFATTVTGTIKDPVSGNLFNGTMTFRLTYNGGRQISTNTALVQPAVPTPIAINNGSLPSGFTLVGNDDMAPRGMAWIASWYDWNGTLLRSSPYYVTGSTFDLGSAVPTPITTSNINLLDLVGLRLFSATKFATGNLSAFYSDVSGNGQFDLATVGGVIKVHFGATGNHFVKQGNLVIGDPGSSSWTILNLYGTDASTSTVTANTGSFPAGAFSTIMSSGTTGNSGGGILFGAGGSFGAAIHYTLQTLSNNSQGDLNFLTRYNLTDAALTNSVFSIRQKNIVVGALSGGNGGGIEPDGGGLKHKRVASCTTGATVLATCNTVITWGTAFADANYSITCTIELLANNPFVVGTFTKTAASVGVQIAAVTAASSNGTIDCIAVHD